MTIQRICRAQGGIAILSTVAVLSVWSTAVFACRGTSEYPQASKRLSAATMTPAKKSALTARLDEGRKKHDEAHDNGDRDLMRESLEILDSVKKGL